jgi:hypothetical protein
VALVASVVVAAACKTKSDIAFGSPDAGGCRGRKSRVPSEIGAYEGAELRHFAPMPSTAFD